MQEKGLSQNRKNGELHNNRASVVGRQMRNRGAVQFETKDGR